MDRDQAELLAIEPLQALAEAISGLSGRVASQLAETEAEILPRFRRLQRALEAAREAVRMAQGAIADAEDEESRRAAERWLERAEEAERRLEYAMSSVRDALSRYKVAAAELDGARHDVFPGAVRHLLEKVAAATAYAAIHVRTGSGAPASGAVEAAHSGPDAGLAAVPLPPGLSWIPIAAIAPDEFVDFADSPAKGVGRDTMERGLRRFYADLVPMLRTNPGITRDELSRVDREEGSLTTSGGLIHPESLANLGDIFLFGRDLIAVEADDTGHYRFNSGRHRATIARDLGMTHVPARAPSPKANR